MKPDFDKAEYLARELRLLQCSNEIPLSVLEMTFDMPIIIDTFENFSRSTNTPISKLTLNGKLKDGYTFPYGVFI